MSTAAILGYPDFFKVAVSCAGNHDNRIYNRWWSETHHGVKETVSENGDTTFVYSIRVANALINANKRFDFLYLPTQRHAFGNMDEYFYWRMVDYFSDYLLNGRQTQVDIPQR